MEKFLAHSIKRLEYYKHLGDATFDQLPQDAFYFQSNESTNSIAIIIQHLYGNMLSRWTNFLTEDGEKLWRKRDAEFEDMHLSKQDLLSFWNEGWKVTFDTLKSLDNNDLEKTIYIRNEPLLVYDAILRQLAHYPYHVGQIVHIAKIIKHTEWKNLSIPKKKIK